MLKWSAIGAFFGCGQAQHSVPSKTSSGPFEIRCTVERSASTNWYNNGTSPFARVSRAYYKVLHEGRPLEITTAGHTVIRRFWQAYFLKDAPQPAVLAALQQVFLITAQGGRPRITPLDEQVEDFATYQWMDSAGGQPGAMHRLWLTGDARTPRFLAGGRRLIINARLVLDVRTLEVFPYDIRTWERVKQFGGYHAGNNPAIAFSPGGTQIVFLGERNNPEERPLDRNALVVLDYARNQAYAVPFNRTDTRLAAAEDATPAWVERYFEWTSTIEGKELLQTRALRQRPPWQGKWQLEADGPWKDRPGSYTLEPVLPTLLPKFMAFIQQTGHVQSLSQDPGADPEWYTLRTDAGDLKLYYNPGEKRIGLSIAFQQQTEASVSLLEKIGKAFDTALASGAYQEDFGRFE